MIFFKKDFSREGEEDPSNNHLLDAVSLMFIVPFKPHNNMTREVISPLPGEDADAQKRGGLPQGHRASR